MCAVCPNCGFDLKEDEPISLAGLEMFPYGNVRFRGVEIRLTPAESSVLWTPLKAKGRPMPRHVLAERYGYEGDHNTVDVLLHRIKHKLAPHGEPPIRTRRGVGVYIEG